MEGAEAAAGATVSGAIAKETRVDVDAGGAACATGSVGDVVSEDFESAAGATVCEAVVGGLDSAADATD